MAKKSILLVSGPNLNLLGEREPEIYGHQTLEEIVKMTQQKAREHNMGVYHWQSNYEGEIVTAIQEARGYHDAIIINAGALTHYAWSIHDALACYEGPIVEVHLSNPKEREEWRHVSVVEELADVVIAGEGAEGYTRAIEEVAKLLDA